MSEESRFCEALDRSWRAVQVLGDHYCALGYDVAIPQPRLRPSFDERSGYGDSYDLEVNDWRFEVKWRGIDFTSVEDFPFATAFVDRAEKADDNVGIIHAYFSLNRALTHALMISAVTKRSWQRRQRFDAQKGYPLTVYECPLRLVRFFSLKNHDLVMSSVMTTQLDLFRAPT